MQCNIHSSNCSALFAAASFTAAIEGVQRDKSMSIQKVYKLASHKSITKFKINRILGAIAVGSKI